MTRSSRSPGTVGFVERFRPGEFERVERVLTDLQALGVAEPRTTVSRYPAVQQALSAAGGVHAILPH
jgi:hypothetical protein